MKLNFKEMAVVVGLAVSLIPGAPTQAAPHVIAQPGPVDYSGVTLLPCAANAVSVVKPGASKVSLFVTNNSSTTISVYWRNADGASKSVNFSPLSPGKSGSNWPQNGLLYEIRVGGTCRHMFAINTNGNYATVTYY
ncbi:hypothetical protein QLQ12_21715 [Actinoplanes sp. NEAU-A12]|uniref:Ig-like domain-containing protein n=1 Tax=Actinoplanes sandaracinus TaxID=3045177 RepID=A0ABT6WNC1_9ACTN|nr:hypothetical protein [Actinoplanes sandaracinus]MDI6101235.1 hypothetical protein [Actinoplanes sandaracinus]